jgi:uncharacterized protein
MRKRILWTLLLVTVGLVAALQVASGQGRGNATPELLARRHALEKELQSIAIVERKLMVPMRDGKRMATDVYRPKDTSKRYPAIFVRTPYNFNFWDVRNGAPRDMSNALEAVKRGYALVEMNERGHFFSEGNYDILGAPLSDGDDAFTWMAKQQGRRHWLFCDRRMADGRRSRGQSGLYDNDPTGLWRGRGARRPIL